MTRDGCKILQADIKGQFQYNEQGMGGRYNHERHNRRSIRLKGYDYYSRGSRDTLEIVKGRFIDVIAYASQLPDFLGDWCGWDVPENCNHGKIEKIHVSEIKLNKNLNTLIKSQEVKK